MNTRGYTHKLNNTVEEFALKISVNEAIRTRGGAAEEVIIKELIQMIKKGVWTPIDSRILSTTERNRVVKSSMFLKEKYRPTGEFEKLKARLVAGGHMQDKTFYDDLSSLTVGTSSVFTVLIIAAHENRMTAVLDIGGAYLNADMDTGVTVHMILDKTMSSMLIKIDPKYGKYTDPKGRITVRLDKALYGCVGSASVWNKNLRATLTTFGYERNALDACIFNAYDTKGVQCTVAVHVDDLFISSCNPAMIDTLCIGLKLRYGEITACHGPILNYLGMVFDLSTKGEAKVNMPGYVDAMLSSTDIQGGARTPGTDILFETRPGAKPATLTEQTEFHRMVAKMLYLAKRARPD